jgi:hypothetical protein
LRLSLEPCEHGFCHPELQVTALHKSAFIADANSIGYQEDLPNPDYALRDSALFYPGGTTYYQSFSFADRGNNAAHAQPWFGLSDQGPQLRGFGAASWDQATKELTSFRALRPTCGCDVLCPIAAATHFSKLFSMDMQCGIDPFFARGHFPTRFKFQDGYLRTQATGWQS